MSARNRLLWPALILTMVATALGAACTGGDATPTSKPTATTPPTATAPAPKATAPNPTGTTLKTTSRSPLGTFLIDSNGNTLYLLTNDEREKSTCGGDCAEVWISLLTLYDPVAGKGVNPELLDAIGAERSAKQVTYNGWPLYLFTGDDRPGDVNGQGRASVWFVVSPIGSPIKAASGLLPGLAR